MVHKMPARKGIERGAASQFIAQPEPVLEAPQEQRLALLADLGLLEPDSIPIFEEAVQTAAHLLSAPVCILGVVDQERQWFKAAVGLSRIGLMNSLATSRQIRRQDAFSASIIDSRQVLMIRDTLNEPAYADGLLTQQYGVRAYLGVPLLTANGSCLGTIEVFDLAPREFTVREVELLELAARWCMSEFERDFLLKQRRAFANTSDRAFVQSQVSSAQSTLLSHMARELRTPLTSIVGMASVLNRGIYGALTEKQKEYLDIVHNSSQHLLTLVNEISELGEIDANRCSVSPADLKMLCQQALSTLEQVAHRREQRLRLTVEPGSRHWRLDKDKVRQMLYHVVFSVIQAAAAESVIRVHVARRHHQLTLSVWTSHPWLGEGLSPAVLAQSLPCPTPIEDAADSVTAQTAPAAELARLPMQLSRQNSGVMLSYQLAALHGGQLTLQGSAEAGYRYVISLPQGSGIH